MSSRDKRIDAYIERSADFAKPILKHIRELVHKACPEIQETVKWGMPHFEYKGIVCGMASFKAHCAFSFWKASLMKDYKTLFQPVGETSMGHLGKITSLKDLPSDTVMKKYIKEAVELNEKGIKLPSKGKKTIDAPEVPEELMSALKRNKKALATFDGFSNSNRKDYIEWITEAKTDATKEKRIATAVEWMSEGKTRHWKYQK